MTREHSWRRGLRHTVVVLAAATTLGFVAPARAQSAATPAGACVIAGRPCFTADQLQQLSRLGDDVMARRIPVDSPVAGVARQVVDFWAGYSIALGYAVASSYLPG